MRHLRTLALLVAALGPLAPAVTAQTGTHCLPTIQPFASNNGGLPGGAVYFDLNVVADIVLTDLVLNFDTAPIGATVGVDVYTASGTAFGNENAPSAWTLVGQGSGTMAGMNGRTILTLDSSVLLTVGQHGMALVATGGAAHDYTNGDGTNQTYSDSFLTIQCGSATHVPFSGQVFSPRVVNMEFCYNPRQGYARSIRVGSGCGEGGPSSFYETFSGTSPNDLAGSPGIRADWNGSSYVVTSGAAAIVAPTGTPLTMGDDQTLQVQLPFTMPSEAGSLSAVWVCSNGWVSFEPTTSTDLTESVTELLALETRIAVLWDDLNPAAGGAIHAEQDPVQSNLFHITWDRVPEFAQSTPNTFQLTLDQSGSWELKYGTLSLVDGMVGYSRGHGVPDPGATDLSAITGPIALGDDRPALELLSVTRPILGQAGVTRTGHIPAGATAGVQLYSIVPVAPPGRDLSGIGMPGCFLYQGGEATLAFGVTATWATHSLNIPSSNVLVGQHLYLQSVVLAPGINQLGAITSNGIDWLFDLL